jgi:hypothetical protein
MFDYAKAEYDRIVERVQQSDTLSQMRQMYADAAQKIATIAGVLGTAAALLALRHRGRTGSEIRT